MLTTRRAAAMLIAACLIGAAPARAALVAFYTFEGNANDVTGNGFNGSVTGATLTASGFEGQAYSFDGVNDRITAAVNINPSVMPKVTIGAWVNAGFLGSSTTRRVVVSHDNGGFDRNLSWDDRNGTQGWSAFTGSAVLNSEVQTVDEWVFVAAVYDDVADTLKLWVGNQLFTSAANPGSGNTSIIIGNDPGLVEDFLGSIDNVFIFDEALSDARIAEIRAGGANAILGVPEPASLSLLSLAALAVLRRRASV